MIQKSDMEHVAITGMSTSVMMLISSTLGQPVSYFLSSAFFVYIGVDDLSRDRQLSLEPPILPYIAVYFGHILRLWIDLFFTENHLANRYMLFVHHFLATWLCLRWYFIYEETRIGTFIGTSIALNDSFLHASRCTRGRVKASCQLLFVCTWIVRLIVAFWALPLLFETGALIPHISFFPLLAIWSIEIIIRVADVIPAVPDFIHISPLKMLRMIANTLTNSLPSPDSVEIENNLDDARLVAGIACRSLFQLTLDILVEKHGHVRIGVTSLQHTSFCKIIDTTPGLTVVPIELDSTRTKLLLPDVPMDVILVTHVFGHDVDLTQLPPDIFVVEDRCQGGRFGRSWRSNERVSISLHSTGMDKRPIALGGGFAAVYGDNNFFDALEARVLSLPLERTRASKILKIVPTYLIYNFSLISGALIVLCKILGIALTQSACEYRRVNPGFSRGNEHMRSPCANLLADMNQELEGWKDIENTILEKSNLWITALMEIDHIHALRILPNKEPSCSIYNTVLVKDADDFIKHMDANGVMCMKNPTYASVTSDDTLDKIVYLPCLSNLTNAHIKKLARITLSFDAASKPKC